MTQASLNLTPEQINNVRVIGRVVAATMINTTAAFAGGGSPGSVSSDAMDVAIGGALTALGLEDNEEMLTAVASATEGGLEAIMAVMQAKGEA